MGARRHHPARGFPRQSGGNVSRRRSGQKGLLATSKDGVTWKNNEPHAERGDIAWLVWTGKQFVASCANGTLISGDGVKWQPTAEKVPAPDGRPGSKCCTTIMR
jgi:hypothetical protein